MNASQVSQRVTQHGGMTVTKHDMQAVAELPGHNICIDGGAERHITPEELGIFVCVCADDQRTYVFHLDGNLLIADGLTITRLLKNPICNAIMRIKYIQIPYFQALPAPAMVETQCP